MGVSNQGAFGGGEKLLSSLPELPQIRYTLLFQDILCISKSCAVTCVCVCE